MRVKVFLSIVGLLAAGAAVALAAPPKVDPATVPTGFFVAHSQVNEVPTVALRRALRSGRTDVFIEHARLGPDQATGFRRHPGPVLITVAAGSLGYEREVRGSCRRRT